MNLKLLVKRLQEYASLKIACDWDNVGLLVEPSGDFDVKKVLITTDLTEPVLEEALRLNVNMIISYHPVIVDPLKRLTQSEWKQRSIVKCIENRIAVYSPHTSWDSINGGINDWIMDAFDTIKVESASEVYSDKTPSGFTKSITIILPTELSHADYFAQLRKLDNIKLISQREILADDTAEFQYVASPKGVATFIELVKKHFEVQVLNTLRVVNLDKPLLEKVGLGRIGQLREKLKISEVVQMMKSYLKMKTLRLALANGKTQDDYVSKIAIGAGCCTDLLNNVDADLIITGEFLHHEILHETHRNVSVILTDHSNTERGYITRFRERFNDLLQSKNDESIELLISKVDRDPLEYV